MTKALFPALFLFSLLLPIQADLVAHYALDETDPGTTVDDSLNKNPGTLIGTAAPTKGFTSPLNTGYDFPLRSGFKIDPATEVQPTDQFTITWWFRPTTLDAFDRLYETLAGTGNDGSGIRIDLGSSPGNQPSFAMAMAPPTPPSSIPSPSPPAIGISSHSATTRSMAPAK
jgi:hypothetical protein